MPTARQKIVGKRNRGTVVRCWADGREVETRRVFLAPLSEYVQFQRTTRTPLQSQIFLLFHILQFFGRSIFETERLL